MPMLNEIIKNKQAELLDLPEVDVASLLPSVRDFRAALLAEGLSVIAEVKRRSPSAGQLATSLDPVEQARVYVRGGASAISVLADRRYFGGSWEDVADVAEAVEVPVLCKEFILDSRQIHHARRAGADACLLIVASVTDDSLIELMNEAESLDMDTLVEVHNEGELNRALQCGAKIIGINNRNLHTMKVDMNTVVRLAERVPLDRVMFAESGYTDAAELVSLPDRTDAVLIGTALMKSHNPTQTLQTWFNQLSK